MRPYNAWPYRRARRAVLDEANGLCQIRGPTCTGRATTIDHVVPVSEGGTNERANLRAACAACNYRGGALLANAKRRDRALGKRSRRW